MLLRFFYGFLDFIIQWKKGQVLYFIYIFSSNTENIISQVSGISGLIMPNKGQQPIMFQISDIFWNLQLEITLQGNFHKILTYLTCFWTLQPKINLHIYQLHENLEKILFFFVCLLSYSWIIKAKMKKQFQKTSRISELTTLKLGYRPIFIKE